VNPASLRAAKGLGKMQLSPMASGRLIRIELTETEYEGSRDSGGEVGLRYVQIQHPDLRRCMEAAVA